MICVCCQRREVETPQVCDPCRLPLPGLLADIAHLYGQLDLTPTANAGPRVTGSRTPPLPLAVDPLDLTMPARVLHLVPGNYAEQTGHLSVASTLDGWVRDWAEIRGFRQPVPMVQVLVDWLVRNLDWACDEHPAVDEFVGEMRRLRATLRAVTGNGEPTAARAEAPCPSCDMRMWRDGEWVRCHCGKILSEAEYADWCRALMGTSEAA